MDTTDIEPRATHTVCSFLRKLRQQAGLSLTDVEKQYGISAVVLGAYERGDRQPPLWKLDQALAVYGYRLAAVPIDTPLAELPLADVEQTLRRLADFLGSQPRGSDPIAA